VALEFAYRHSQRHPRELVFWIYASNEYRFRQSFVDIADRLNIPGCQDREADVLRLTRDWLKRQSELRWLMIIDNADDETLFFGLEAEEQGKEVLNPGLAASRLNQYIPECPQGASILTTRNKKVAVKFTKGRNLIELRGLETNESIELVSALIDTDGSQKEDIKILLDRLDKIPLALAQATAYMQENTVTVSQYLRLLDQGSENAKNLLSTEFEASGRTDDVPNAVISTWIVSFNQIRSTCRRAARILSLIAFYDRQNIPDFLLLRKPDMAEDRSLNPNCTSVSKSPHLLFDAEDLGELPDDGEEVDLEFTQACGTLKAFSLLRETSTPGFYEVHRLVRLAIHKWLGINNELQFSAATSINTVMYFFPSEPRIEDWPACAIYLPHALSVIAEAVALGVQYRQSFLALVLNVSKYLWDSWHKETSTLNRLGVEVAERLYAKDDPRSLRMRHRLASELLSRGQLQEAEGLELQILHCYDYRSYDYTFLFSLVGLAEIRKEQGRLKNAEGLLKSALEFLKIWGISRYDGSFKHIETLIEFADVCRLQKCFNAAKPALKEARSMLERKSSNPYLLLKLEKCQAGILQDQGELEEAQLHFSSILSRQSSILGSDHPDVLKTRTQIAVILKRRGHSTEAIQSLTECCESSRGVLGSEHLLTRQRHQLLEAWQQKIEQEDADSVTATAVEQPNEDEPDDFLRALEGRLGQLRYRNCCRAALTRFRNFRSRHFPHHCRQI
jgi:tetratricopeptide (TPR) repeat protein